MPEVNQTIGGKKPNTPQVNFIILVMAKIIQTKRKYVNLKEKLNQTLKLRGSLYQKLSLKQ